MSTDQPKTWRQRCGGRYGIVSAAAIEDTSLSTGARLLYTILCGHADGKTDTAKRSLDKLAADIGADRRTVLRWIDEIERAQWLVKQHSIRRLGTYRLIRDASRRDEVSTQTMANRMARITENHKRHLAALPYLQVLIIRGYRILDRDLDVLAECDKLKYLGLHKTSVSENAVGRLIAAMPRCQVVVTGDD